MCPTSSSFTPPQEERRKEEKKKRTRFLSKFSISHRKSKQRRKTGRRKKTKQPWLQRSELCFTLPLTLSSPAALLSSLGLFERRHLEAFLCSLLGAKWPPLSPRVTASKKKGNLTHWSIVSSSSILKGRRSCTCRILLVFSLLVLRFRSCCANFWLICFLQF